MANWTYSADDRTVYAPSVVERDGQREETFDYPRIIAELPDDWDQAQHGQLLAAAPQMYHMLKICEGFLASISEKGQEGAKGAHEMLIETLAAAEGIPTADINAATPTEAIPCCPECGSTDDLGGRADVYFRNGEWEVGDMESEVECSKCDWVGDVTDLAKQ